jgi:hypothetical protein
MRNLWTIGLLLGSAACWANVDDGGELPMTNEGQCELGALRCDGPVLMLCTDGGTNWAALEVCASAALCDPGASGCQDPECFEGETRCYGYQFQACADQRIWETVEACASSATCAPLTGCE